MSNFRIFLKDTVLKHALTIVLMTIVDVDNGQGDDDNGDNIYVVKKYDNGDYFYDGKGND